MDVAIDMQMIQAGGDVFEERVDLIEVELSSVERNGRACLHPRMSSGSFSEILRRIRYLSGVTYVLLQITGVAVLLQNKSAWYTWTKVRKLDIFKPDMSIRYEVLM